MLISIVIPCLNEAENLVRTLRQIQDYSQTGVAEVLVVDAGSTDATVAIAQQAGAKVIVSPKRGRANQMNLGAAHAQGNVLYFVHADVHLHPDFENDIQQALQQGYALGCYRYQFDRKHPLLAFNAWCTRFDRIWCRGGDQTLFIRKSDFQSLGGFQADHLIMEDYEFILRARKQFKFKIIPKNITVSARKYDTNGYFRVQFANLTIMLMYFVFGASQEKMVSTYKKLLNYR